MWTIKFNKIETQLLTYPIFNLCEILHPSQWLNPPNHTSFSSFIFCFLLSGDNPLRLHCKDSRTSGCCWYCMSRQISTSWVCFRVGPRSGARKYCGYCTQWEVPITSAWSLPGIKTTFCRNFSRATSRVERLNELVTMVSVRPVGGLVVDSYRNVPMFKISSDFKNSKTKMCFRPFWATLIFRHHPYAPYPTTTTRLGSLQIWLKTFQTLFLSFFLSILFHLIYSL